MQQNQPSRFQECRHDLESNIKRWFFLALSELSTRSLSMLKPAIACRLDSESEKITNFFNFDPRITSIARNKAYSSARKMLVRSESRMLLVMPLYTIAEATQSPALEPSVYMRQ